MSFYGERMKKLMEDRRLSAKELAARVRVDVRTINMIINGDIKRTKKSNEIAKALGTTHEYLMYGKCSEIDHDSAWLMSEISQMNLKKDQIEAIINIARVMSTSNVEVAA